MLTHGLARLLSWNLSRSWASWVGMTESRARCIDKMRRAVSFFVHRDLAVGFVTWRGACSPHSRDVSARAIYRMLNQKISDAWATWYSSAVTCSASMQLLRKGVSFFLNQHLALAMGAWRSSTACHRRKVAHTYSMTRALSHFINLELSRGWVQWRAMSSALAHAQAALWRGVMHMLHREVSRSWASWSQSAKIHAS